MKQKVDSNFVSIDIDDYIRITGCDPTFTNSWLWDEENGLEISNNKTSSYEFFFKIIDKQKFFLAKIKYGI